MIAPFTTTQCDKTLFKECTVAGWNFRDLRDTLDELCEGTKLVLVRERNNKYDANAIAVVLEDDYDADAVADGSFDFQFAIGYVPRTENELMARMMDMGWGDAFTAELTTVKRYGPYADRLRMSIYIQRKEETTEANAGRVFAVRLDDETYRLMTQELFANGFSSFIWGDGAVWRKEFQLPKCGDNVVFIHEQLPPVALQEPTTDDAASTPQRSPRRQRKVDLYLMHVMADSEEKVKFFFPNSPSPMVCDAVPFVLTCVKGPLTVKHTVLAFLDGESVEDYQSERPLTAEAAQKMLSLLA